MFFPGIFLAVSILAKVYFFYFEISRKRGRETKYSFPKSGFRYIYIYRYKSI